MRAIGKRELLGIWIDAIDYERAAATILTAAARGRSFAVTGVAVNQVMRAIHDATYRSILNQLDMIVPDGRLIRLALNMLYGTRLNDRVYIPKLMHRLCELAAASSLPIYLFATRRDVLASMATDLVATYPGLQIAGIEAFKTFPDPHPRLDTIATHIRESGARIAFVGLSSPEQEEFTYLIRSKVSMPVVAVNSAFELYEARLQEDSTTPVLSRRESEMTALRGLVRWARRHIILNPTYVLLVTLQLAGLRPFVKKRFPSSAGHQDING